MLTHANKLFTFVHLSGIHDPHLSERLEAVFTVFPLSHQKNDTFLPANLIVYITASFRKPSERGYNNQPVIRFSVKSVQVVISFGKFVTKEWWFSSPQILWFLSLMFYIFPQQDSNEILLPLVGRLGLGDGGYLLKNPILKMVVWIKWSIKQHMLSPTIILLCLLQQ